MGDFTGLYGVADLYQVLGVAKTATEDEIRAAYRKLAKANHPDLNPGNKGAESKFKAIAAAYGIVGDPDKRRRYDAGEIDDTGAERTSERTFYRDYAEARPGQQYEPAGGFAGYEDFGGIFEELYRQSRAGAKEFADRRGRDVHYRLSIDFLDAVNGARRRIELPDGKSLDVTIPQGVEDGQVLRLAGMGGAGLGKGAPGDALVEITVSPHRDFRREGTTIHSVLPVTLKEAIAGGSVRVETVTGPVDLRVPKASNSGTILRLRGKGAPDQRHGQRGDHLVELRVVLPDKPDSELERLVSEWEQKNPYNPRKPSGAG